jgi:hypothetical protein
MIHILYSDKYWWEGTIIRVGERRFSVTLLPGWEREKGHSSLCHAKDRVRKGQFSVTL